MKARKNVGLESREIIIAANLQATGIQGLPQLFMVSEVWPRFAACTELVGSWWYEKWGADFWGLEMISSI